MLLTLLATCLLGSQPVLRVSARLDKLNIFFSQPPTRSSKHIEVGVNSVRPLCTLLDVPHAKERRKEGHVVEAPVFPLCLLSSNFCSNMLVVAFFWTAASIV